MNKQSQRYLALVFGLILVPMAWVLLYLWGHWCPAQPNVAVKEGGKVVNEFKLCKCQDGSLVLWVEDKGLGAVYAVYPDQNRVASVSETNFIKISSGIFAKSIPIDSVFLGDVTGKNDEIQPQLVIDDNRISFRPNSPHDPEEIEISWEK